LHKVYYLQVAFYPKAACILVSYDRRRVFLPRLNGHSIQLGTSRMKH
jgi:hypothetical protein